MAGLDEYHWLSEAVVDFLRGPLYINPLMAFIDDRCLLFTPEEENKFEYTQVHADFKDLVDYLLTGFLEELGISPEIFYEILASTKDKDKLSDFVVRTILTVDDFLLFKAMMVKRNIDLTNQVLAAMEEVRESAGRAMRGDATAMETSAQDEAKMLEAAMQLSQSARANEEQWGQMVETMRLLQIEDEDPAMIIAMANSLKGNNAVDTELAELEQAIAMSLALEAEQQRLKAGGDGGGDSGKGATVQKNGATSSLANMPSLNPAASKAAASEMSAAAQKADKDAASGAPQKPKPSMRDIADVGGPKPDSLMMGTASKQISMKGMAEFKADGASKEAAMAHKAQLLASRQAGSEGDDAAAAQQWMMDAKKKLVASKKVERQAEMESYKAGKGQLIDSGALMPQKKGNPDELEAKRAALREKLASKFKQDMLQQAGNV